MKIKQMMLLTVFAVGAAGVVHAQEQTPLERGTYLMSAIVACGNCHTTLGPDGPVPGMELAGGFLEENEMFTAYAANITQDIETGIGAWTDDEIKTAIREGRRPDGSVIGPIMPIGLYRGMSDTDVEAIIAYLRQVAPVKNEVPESTWNFPLPENYGPPVGSVPDVPREVSADYGAYLAGPLGHCIECHSPLVQGVPDFANQLGAGGNEFHGPWGVSVSANLTSSPDGLARWSDDEVKQMITTGTRPDDTPMFPPMGYAYYANLTAGDLESIVAYLRTLPPKEMGVPQ